MKRVVVAAITALTLSGASLGMIGAISSPAFASSYPSWMNRGECMREVPNDACIGYAPYGDHVDMICWVGDGPLVLGSRKWFDIASQDGGGGFVPAPAVSNQTWTPWCGF